MSVPSLLSIFGNSGGEDPVYVDDVFSTYLWGGNSTDNRAINNGIDIDGEGGLVWIKNRDLGENHILSDSERGATSYLQSNSNTDSSTSSTRVKSFTSTGFTLGTDGNVNATNYNYASWTFRKAPGFFDVVTYTGNGVAGRTISHSLGSVPGMIVIKRTNASEDWIVGHRSIGLGTGRLMLNDNTGNSNNNATQYWNSTAATSSQFTVGSHVAVNGDGSTYVAYLFAHDEAVFGTDGDESIIKCGITPTISQFGNANIELGFEPQFLLVKAVDISGSWVMLDVMRGIGTSVNNPPAILNPNSASSEGTSSDAAAIFSTGYSQKEYSSGNTRYIYMAIRRPNKPPQSGTEVFAIDNQATGTKPPQYHSNFVVDMAIVVAFGEPQQYRYRQNYSRLMGPKRLLFNSTDDEANSSSARWDYMDGFYNNNSSESTTYSWMFKRTPGFFDVVAYTGTGSSHNINHNLTVPPELIIAKNRSTDGQRNTMWSKYLQSDGVSGKWLSLDSYDIAYGGSKWRVNSNYTSTVFGVGTDGYTNASGDNYISYLFASLDGISKVGTYTGTGSNVNVDCGFTSGARFIMIKRTDTEVTSGVPTYAYVWDTVRGIVSGNDPYFAMSTADAEVTNTDYIDPLSTGFTVTSSAPAALNTSGGTYLFLAIA